MVKDTDILEKVQQRASKWVKGLKNKCYRDRLRILNFTTLEKRRKRGDLIEAYKIISGKKGVDSSHWLPMTTVCEDISSIQAGISPQHPKKNFFSQRVINDWNRLHSHVVEAPSHQFIQEQTGRLLDRYGQLKS